MEAGTIANYKTCKTCGQLKPATEFYARRRECKVCTGKRVKQNRCDRLRIDKRGVRYNPDKGRMMKGNTIHFNAAELSDLKRFYANTSNEELAGIFGVSARTVYRRAKELGLRKSDEFMRKAGKENGLLGIIKRRKMLGW
jgi:hypothetical protein